MRAAPENIRIPDQFCALATDPSVMRYANPYSQLFGAPLRVTVASIHTGTVVTVVCCGEVGAGGFAGIHEDTGLVGLECVFDLQRSHEIEE